MYWTRFPSSVFSGSSGSRRSGRLRPRLVALGALVAVLGLPGLTREAAAAGPKEAQARKALKEAVDDDYLQTRFDDAENRLRAALQSCGTTGCSAQLRAQLHAALGAVLAGGKKEMEDARDEFVEALQLDPKVQPDPGMLSANVTFAFEQAKKKLKRGPAASAPPPPPPEPTPDDPSRKKPRPKDPEPDEPRPDKDSKDAKDKDGKDPEAPSQRARKNWITLAFPTSPSSRAPTSARQSPRPASTTSASATTRRRRATPAPPPRTTATTSTRAWASPRCASCSPTTACS